MKSTVKMAKTIDDAVRLAINELQVSREDVDIEVLEKPKSGLFGFIGAKDAVVKVSVKDNVISEETEFVQDILYSDREKVQNDIKREAEDKTKAEKIDIKEETFKVIEENSKIEVKEDDDYANIAKEFLQELLDKMNIECDVKMTEEDRFLKFEIFPVDKKETGIIIGKRGDTLDAIQYLVNLVTNMHSKEYIRISLDINNYRKKRAQSLKTLAKRMAKKAKKFKKDIKLEPMNPYERRLIHSALQDEDGIKTVSEGEEPYRRVVIRYINK